MIRLDCNSHRVGASFDAAVVEGVGDLIMGQQPMTEFLSSSFSRSDFSKVVLEFRDLLQVVEIECRATSLAIIEIVQDMLD